MLTKCPKWSTLHTQTQSPKHNDRWDLTVHFACHARWGWPFKTTGKQRERAGDRREERGAEKVKERERIERDSHRELLKLWGICSFKLWIGGLLEIPQDARVLLFAANLLEQSAFSLIALFLFVVPLYSLHFHSSLYSIPDTRLSLNKQSLWQVDSGPKLFRNAYPTTMYWNMCEINNLTKKHAVYYWQVII